jgi:hypothetical protein
MSKTWYFDQLDSAQQAEVVTKTALLVAPGRLFSKRFQDKKESLAKMMLEAASLTRPFSLTIKNNEGSVAVNGNATVQSISNKRKVAPETNEEDAAAVTPTKRVEVPPLKSVPSSMVVEINNGALAVNGDATLVKESTPHPPPPTPKHVQFLFSSEQVEGRLNHMNDINEVKDIALEALEAAQYYKNKSTRCRKQHEVDLQRDALKIKLVEEQRNYEQIQALRYREQANQYREEIEQLKSQLHDI